jgi:hypothetical protein
MFHKQLSYAGHTRSFEIEEAGGVWEVRTREDSRTVRRVQYDDWHRVERAMFSIRLEVVALEEQGWVVES